MRARSLLILFLVGCALIYQATVINAIFFAKHQAAAPGFMLDTQISAGSLRMRFVPERNRDGTETVLWQAGLRPGDLLVAVTNQSGQTTRLRSMRDYSNALQSVEAGKPWSLTVERTSPTGAPQHLALMVPAIPAESLPLAAMLFLVCMHVILPLTACLAATILGLSKPDDRHACLAAVMLLAFATIAGYEPFSLPTIGRWIALSVRQLGQSLAAPLLLAFFFVFPSPSPFERAWPWARGLAMTWGVTEGTVSMVIALLRELSLEQYSSVVAMTPVNAMLQLMQRASAPIAIACVTIAIFSLVLNRKEALTPDERHRLSLMQAACLISWTPLGVVVMLQQFGMSVPTLLIVLVSLTTPVFPLTFVYVVLKHRVFGIRLIIRRGLQYALVSRGVWALVLLLFAGTYALADPMLRSIVPVNAQVGLPIASAVVAVGLAAGLRAANQRIMPMIDRRFFRDAYDTREVLSQLGSNIQRLAGRPKQLIDTVAAQIDVAFHPRSVAIYQRDRSKSGFRPATSRGVEATPPWLFDQQAAAIRELERSIVSQVEPIDLVPSQNQTHIGRHDPIGALLDRELAVQELADDFYGRLLVPVTTNQRLIGFLMIGEKRSEEPFSKEDRELLTAVAGQLAIALEYAALIGEAAENERIKQELAIAQDVQAQLFPRHKPDVAGLKVTGACRPAREVGGDYYDFVSLADGKLAIALGDISGKGVSAALLMASLQGALRSHAAIEGSVIAETVTRLNVLMCRTAPSSKFATLFYAHWDPATRTIGYTNAGHNPPFLLRAQDGRIERLESTGMLIGVLERAVYQVCTVTLQPGDLVVAFTDGISEATDPAGEFFADKRLERLIRDYGDAEITALQELIFAEVVRFAGSAPQHDDMTLVLLRVE
jgi:sigma-B regulation protein RsbU (phosphoserine phosphatase)